jgi:crossover junction endodeoxyribonuclease RusA
MRNGAAESGDCPCGGRFRSLGAFPLDAVGGVSRFSPCLRDERTRTPRPPVERFEFVIPGRPVSVHARNRGAYHAWKESVLIEAIRNSPATFPFTNFDARLTIVFVSEERSPIDVDNVIKPIQDALTGVFYGDDEMVSDVEAHRRTWADEVNDDGLPNVLRAAWEARQDCVYVRIQKSVKLRELL